jgi:alpha-beta hydrolase superfamily lysophospholipase
MKHFEFEYQTSDGLRLFAQGWQPETKTKGVVSLVHGLGEHSGRYTHVANTLTRAGYALVGFDLRGHGKSHGQRGHTPSYKVLMDDITNLLNEVLIRFPGRPCFLYGHSMGGNLVLNYVLRHQPYLAGVIATSPDLGLSFKPASWKVAMGHIMNNLCPNLSITTGLDIKALSQIPEVVRNYKNDSFTHNRISPRLFVSIRHAAGWAIQNSNQFKLPLLLMHGGNDRLTSATASRQFAVNVSGDCTFMLWDGLYHEIHNEPRQDEVFNSLIAWLQSPHRRRRTSMFLI